MTVLEIEAAVTERGQTTVPAAIRAMLRLGKPSTIVFRAMDDGTVTIARKAKAEEEDPVLGGFLSFLSADMAAHPEHIQPMTAGMVEGIAALVEGVEVDLDSPLSSNDE